MNDERDNENDDRSRREAIDSGDTKEHGDKAHAQEQRFEHARDFTEQDRDLTAERQKKAEIVEEMVSKDFPLSSEKRLDNAKDFHYADTREFGNELEKRDGAATEEDKRLTEGFYDSGDKQAFVKNEGDTLKTSIHEKLHQKSMSELPTRTNEGVTEYLARQEAGSIGDLKNIDSRGRDIPKPLSDYEREVNIVGKLDALVGDKPINSAYFDGKTEVLREHVDNALSEGSFQKISDALEKRDYDTAAEIIEKRNKT